MVQFNVPALFVGFVSILPAALVLYLGFARYDGHFRDQTLFLHFMGGLILGAVLSLVALVLLVVMNPLAFVPGFALLVEIVKTALVNRKQWVRNRHAVFNGAGMGTGAGVMLAFAFGTKTVGPVVGWRPGVDLVLLAVGFVFLQFATGARVGVGVHHGHPIRGALAAAGLALPLVLAMEEWYRGWLVGAGFVLTWPIVAAAVGVAAFVYARFRLLPEGLEPDARRALRRKERRERPSG